MHKVKCKYCEQVFDTDKEPFVLVSAKRYAHKECEKYKETQTPEEKERESFFEYTKKLFGSQYNYLATQKLAEQYIKKHKYTYSGMLKSLIWFYDITKHSTEKSNGSIGIIPYIYDQAREYYYSLYLMQIANQNKDIKAFAPKQVEVKIKRPRPGKRKHKLFNLDD